jgi:hypothetical protein
MGRKKKNKNYFTEETEEAILLYNSSINDYEFRDKLYNEKIHYAFLKLTENIIHTFKFYHTEVNDLKDLQYEVISFLLSKLHLYSQEKGKAYSYFGTIAKRYLILSNKKNYKKKLELISLEDTDFDDDIINDDNLLNPNTFLTPEEFIEEPSYINDISGPKTKYDDLSDFIDIYIEYCTNNLYVLFPKENDAKIADAVLEIFRKRDNINIFNKKALYIYIKEMIDAKTPKITKISDKLYNLFKIKYLFYIENGYFNIYK